MHWIVAANGNHAQKAIQMNYNTLREMKTNFCGTYGSNFSCQKYIFKAALPIHYTGSYPIPLNLCGHAKELKTLISVMPKLFWSVQWVQNAVRHFLTQFY